MKDSNIYSVSQLNQSVRQILEGQIGLVWLTGEISNFSQPVSGHWYLTLKDECAQVRCAMFRMKNLRVVFKPQNGMQVLVRTSVSLYEPRGDYQLIIESMHLAGDGLLQQQFDILKMKLAEEGLFAQNLKKSLPYFSKAIGIITSQTGAVLQDILQILQRRDPCLKIVIYPTMVQGKDAASEIVQMIELANRRNEVNILIVARGGGSLEDLWCFNEEIVARAIFNSAIPIISAIGHETDITIADFVADVRAPTPSAAAELVSRDQNELLQQLMYKCQRLEMALDRLFNQKNQQLQQLLLRLQNQHPRAELRSQQQRILQFEHRLSFVIRRIIDKIDYKLITVCERLYKTPLPFHIKKQSQYLIKLEVQLAFLIQKKLTNRQYYLANLCGRLDGLSPLKVLARGYSIVEDEQREVITNITQVKNGDILKIHVTDGMIFSRVEKCSK